MKRLATILAGALALPAAAPAAASALPPIKHVFIVMLENKDYDTTFGASSKAPYLARTLPSKGAKLEQYYGIGHFSLGNYLALISGQALNPITQADCPVFTAFTPALPVADGQYLGMGCVYPKRVQTIANQLEAKGLRWKGYMEDMANGAPGEAKSCRHPDVGSQDHSQHAEVGDQYAARHNPFVYFRSIIDTPSCAKNNVDYRQLAGDLTFPSVTPQFAMITPNLCNDGHDDPCVDDPGNPGGLPKINAWLAREIPYLLESPGFRDDGLLIVTFDEAEDDASACCNEQKGPNTPNPGGLTIGPGGGRTGAVLISPFIKPGTIVSTPYNHYSLLRSMEDLFGLPHLGYAGQAGLRPFGSDIYNQTPKLTVKVKPRRIRPLKRRTLRIKVNRQATVRFAGRCKRGPRQTDVFGRLQIKVRARHRGRCRIQVERNGWQSARTRVKVLRARKRH